MLPQEAVPLETERLVSGPTTAEQDLIVYPCSIYLGLDKGEDRPMYTPCMLHIRSKYCEEFHMASIYAVIQIRFSSGITTAPTAGRCLDVMRLRVDPDLGYCEALVLSMTATVRDYSI